MAVLDLVRLVEVGLGIALGLCVVLRSSTAEGRLESPRSWLPDAALAVATFLTLALVGRLGLSPLAAVLSVAGVFGALTHRRRLTVACFVLASLWLGPWWALFVLIVSPVAMAGLVVADRYDHRLPVWLLGASAVGAGLALPDVEVATFFAAAFATIAVGSIDGRQRDRSRRIATGSHLVPFLLWGFALSAQGRPPSIVGAVGALAVLLVVPVLGLLVPLGSMPRGRWSWVAVQTVGAGILARHAGLSTTWGRPLLVVAGGLVAVAIVVILLERFDEWRSGRSSPAWRRGVEAAAVRQ